MELRDYQLRAVEAVYDYLRERDGNPCVVIPTGGGKTPVLAQICRDAVDVWGGRVVVLAHVKELLEQAAEKLRAMAPGLPVGVYSAGLGQRDLGYAVTIAGIQSVHQRADSLGKIDLVIVDEAHLIPPDGEGMYRRFLADAKAINPHLRVIGLTATPYRMKSGTICGADHILTDTCYEVGVRELIARGFLCPLRSKAGSVKADTSGLHVRAGEFVAGEVEDLMDEDGLVESACAEIVGYTVDRRSVLIFCSGVRHGEHVARILSERHGVECGFVCGETPASERNEILNRFKQGDLRFLANINVLTTGFDAPNIDCIALLRPTLSPGLYYQMVGRGFRIDEGKSDCLVLDFGGNVIRHGPVDAIRIGDPGNGTVEAPAKECPECRALIHAGYQVCPECGHSFPPRETTKHEAHASGDGVLSSDEPTCRTERVGGVEYAVHYKGGDPDATPTMRVEYRIGFNKYMREWVCFEHTGYALTKASQWWFARSNDVFPSSVEEAIEMAQAGALAETRTITIERQPGEKYERIIAHELGEKPPRIESDEGLPEYVRSAGYEIDESEIPF